MSRRRLSHVFLAATAAILTLAVAFPGAAEPFERTLLLEGGLGPDHRDTGGGNDAIVNMRITLRDQDLAVLHLELQCGVHAIGKDGLFSVILGESLPVVAPFDGQTHALVEACYDRDGCDGVVDVDACDPRDLVVVEIPVVPVAMAHRAYLADTISDDFIFGGDVEGPSFDLQLLPGVVGTPEIADGAVTLPKLGFDTATQVELDAEEAARIAADTAEADARAAADTAEAATRAAADTAEAAARSAADTAEAAARTAGDVHSGDVTGPHTNLQIQPSTVGTTEIADGSIRFADLGQNGANDRDYVTWNGSAWVRNELGNLGSRSTAGGYAALPLSGDFSNTAFGFASQEFNATGWQNTSLGDAALNGNADGARNVALGAGANDLATTGSDNVVIGVWAMRNGEGNGNIVLGTGAGGAITTGSDNILLDNDGVAGDDRTIRIGSDQTRTFVAGIATSPLTGQTVVVDASGRLGTSGSAPASDNHSGDVAGPSANLQIQPNTVGSTEVNSSQVQLRVSGSCPSGQSIRSISATGAVTCEVDTDTDTDTQAALSVRTTEVSIPGHSTWEAWRGCPGGYTVIGGGCGHRDGDPFLIEASEVYVSKSAPMANLSGWHCIMKNTHADPRGGVADVICLRTTSLTTSINRGGTTVAPGPGGGLDRDIVVPLPR